ncbi:MAG: heme ABC exporter ATP-binding protein CcmA [Deltaproteobacteria bacterium]|nr:heme ABC exporter ATP-binding protein CcmA [Deltaproteobacteria bacterium]
MPAALEVEHLTKRFGRAAALDDVSLRVEAGASALLLGPNGAGKTTLLRCAATLLRPQRGVVRIAGLDAATHGAAVRRRLAVLGHESFLYPDLTPLENLAFYARLYRLDRPEQRALDLIEQLGLRGWTHRPVRTLSRGLVQRCALARVLLHAPDLLLLDEPFTGLDAEARALLSAVLRNAHARGTALLMSTHDLDLGLALCQRAVILAGGRLAWQGDVSGQDAARLDAELRRLSGRAAA